MKTLLAIAILLACSTAGAQTAQAPIDRLSSNLDRFVAVSDLTGTIMDEEAVALRECGEGLDYQKHLDKILIDLKKLRKLAGSKP